MLDFQPLSGWPTQVMESLWRIVHDLVEDPHVRGFQIGSTNDLRGRYNTFVQAYQQMEPPKWIIPLYQTTNVHHALDVESELSRAFGYHLKYRWGTPYGGKELSPYAIQYVYLLVWM